MRLLMSSSNFVGEDDSFLEGRLVGDAADERKHLAGDVALRHRMISALDSPLAVRRST
jgi:hypothetical protein